MKLFVLCAFLIFMMPAYAQYRQPPEEIVKIVDIPDTPVIRPSIYTGVSVRIFTNSMPDVIDLAKPFLKLAGERIIPANFSSQRESFYNKFEFFETKSLKDIPVSGMPANLKASTYSWSNTGKYFAFTNVLKDSVELWVADLQKKEAKKVAANLNTILTSGFMWMPKHEDTLLVCYAANVTRKPPELDAGSISPVIQQTGEKASKVRTYQDLLQNQFDEKQFTYYFSSILALVDINTGKKDYLTKSGVFYLDDISPDGNYLLFDEYMEPYSYTVPWYYFTREHRVLNLNTKEQHTLVHHPISDSVSIGGVYTGSRYYRWQPYEPATLIYFEALDDGDPEKTVDYRDRMMMCAAPFNSPKEVLKIKHRYSSLIWLQDNPGKAFLKEYDWKKRWNTTHLIDINKQNPYIKIIEDISAKDAYNTMGSIQGFTDKEGNYTAIYKNGCIYTVSSGATENGYFPFLMRVNLDTLEKEKVFQCRDGYYERFLRFTESSFNNCHIFVQSPTVFPNYYEYDISKQSMRQITFNKDPAPEISGVKKELIKYKRADGIELSGVLYYPVGFKKGDKVPAFVHAYPLEYNDAKTAGQVRGSQYTFTKLGYDSYLFFLMQGVAVFMNAQFPIVGDPKTMNDSYLDQLKLNADAAVKALKDTGDIDTTRLACIGHSYGAFMVANLLIHTDLFKTGIAQSGAYNRTLTPFGFQSERRTLWEARDTYIKVSPFMYADQLKKPILLVHGEIDDNPGTYTIQSDRLFAALKGVGGNARYVKLPYEKHSYSARESILHLLYERYTWVEEKLKK